MKRLWLLGLLLTACTAPGERVGSGGVPVERVAQFDGCTLFRFVDSGKSIYVTRCPYGVAMAR